MLYRHRRRGFTRIEQLVLVPIVPTLAVILSAGFFPGSEKKPQDKKSAQKAALAKAPVEKALLESPDEIWRGRIEPMLDKKCLKCHAGVRQQGGLDLRSLQTILRGGDRGPALIPGRPNESRMLQFVAVNASEHMPPDVKKQLTPEEIAALKSWIARLPVPKSRLASGTSTNNTWVADYLADYERQYRSLEVPPAKLSASATIDWFLQTDWKRSRIEPARLSDDSTFARRLYLDLAGRIPSQEELTQFLTDVRRDKRIDQRARLIDKLIASDDYPRHMREVFDTVLMGRPTDKNARERVDKGWNAFLEEAFRTNRPWNEVVRDMLVARPAEGPKRGAVWFLAERNNSHQAMAEAVAPVVFGVQIKCAQCHNHPLSWEIEQRHYWGLVAVFNRSKNVTTESGIGVAESATGGFINFANLKKESQPATLVFLNGKSVHERIPPMDEKEVDSPDLYVVPPVKEGQKVKNVPVPRFSRREAFSESVTRNNPLLARAFVNRMWASLMGRGIVQPADQIDSKHRASHPELLEWLAHDFDQSGCDVKRLVRNITLSRAYQLDSKPGGKTPPPPDAFARAQEKPLSAEQLLHSLLVATGSKLDASASAELERSFVLKFPDLMPDTYSPSLQQALFLSNSPVLEDLLKPAPGATVAKLTAIGPVDARVREAFNVTLGRAPDATEMQQCKAMLAAQSPEKGVRNLLWALLTCAEFKVNH